MSNCYDFTNALRKVEFKDSQKDKTKLTVLEEIKKNLGPRVIKRRLILSTMRQKVFQNMNIAD